MQTPRPTHFFALMFALVGPASIAAAQDATFSPLTPLPPNSFASILSGDGQAHAGYTQVNQAAFVATPGAGLVFPGAPAGYDGASVRALDRTGDTLVGYAYTTSGSNDAFRWTSSGGFEVIPAPPGLPVSWSGAAACSADGSVVVGTLSSGFPISYGFRWTAQGGLVLLGDLPGGAPRFDVHDCSADGSVIVGSSGSGVANDEAAMWTAATGVVGLGELPGGAASGFARHVSADGTTIVGESHTAAGWELFRWTAATGMVSLGDLPTGDVWAFARGINGDGSVIIGHGTDGSGLSVPFLWTEELGIIALRDYAAGLGAANLQDWELSSVDAISDSGDVVIGVGLHLGVLTSYRLDLRDPALGVTVCTPAAPNSTGGPGRLSAVGTAGAGADDLTLFVTSLPASSQCLLLVAPAVGSPVQPANSQGNLCLSGPIGRYAGQTFTSSIFGAGALEVDLGALPGPNGAVTAMPGQTWTFQAWHRDANPLPTSNFTAAVSVFVQ